MSVVADNGLSFWYELTQAVLEYWPLCECCIVCIVCVRKSQRALDFCIAVLVVKRFFKK